MIVKSNVYNALGKKIVVNLEIPLWFTYRGIDIYIHENYEMGRYRFTGGLHRDKKVEPLNKPSVGDKNYTRGLISYHATYAFFSKHYTDAQIRKIVDSTISYWMTSEKKSKTLGF